MLHTSQIRATYDGQVLISYVDGREVTRKEYASGVGPTADTPKEADSLKGHYDINWGAFTQKEDWSSVCLDDTLITGRPLTPSEVQALYDAMLK